MNTQKFQPVTKCHGFSAYSVQRFRFKLINGRRFHAYVPYDCPETFMRRPLPIASHFSSGMSPPRFPLGTGTDSDHFYHLGKMVGGPFQSYDFTIRLLGNVHSSLAPFGSATVLIIFFSSEATRRSSFLRSSSEGSSSGFMPRSTSRFRTL